ncbi:hypothetical protein ACJO2E_02445 [Marinobacter sp. M1N3S26]|uniref:hypothetical protein n=1 Tax=Marinobacter sp. M1N3S26 TaxID=3382299 RepID=UPI00387B1FBD
MGDGTHAPRFLASPPLDIMTDGGSGPNRRLRVDVAQTGFFAGREFRTFLELDMADGESIVVRATVPINVILFGLTANLVAGEIRIETIAGGTEGGTFDDPLPIFNRNNMSSRPMPAYQHQVDLDAGGTHSGGLLLDVLLNKAADNANFASTVDASQGDERGVAPDTYYFRMTATGATRGVFRARWEERPEGVY